LIIVGAGFYGLTIAERAQLLGLRVAVLDRRDTSRQRWSDGPCDGIEYTGTAPSVPLHNQDVWITSQLTL